MSIIVTKICSLSAWCVLAAVLLPSAVLAHWSEEEHSLHLDLNYAGESWHAAEGGIKSGSAYLDNLDLTLEVDGQQLSGINGLTVFAHALYNNGGTITEHRVGDAQGISGIEAVRALRLFQLWAEWSAAEDAHSLLFGLYDVNSEFDVTPSAELFLGASHGMGREFSQSGGNGPSTFPSTSLTLRYRKRFNQEWFAQAAVLDGVPGDPDDLDRTTIDLSSDDGALLVAEIVREVAASKFAAGAWQYTARFDELMTIDPATEPARHRSNRGAYLLADMTVAELSDITPWGDSRLSAFLRYGVANDRVNRFGQYLGVGLVLNNAMLPDGGDALGISLSHARNGDDYRRLSRAMGDDTDTHETIFEVTWRAPVNDWLTLQPNLQYVRNPDTDPRLDDALVLGLRFEIAMGTSW